MAKKPPSAGKKPTRCSATRVAVGGSVDRHGREAWHVSADGKRRTAVTSGSSAAAMDEAVRVFNGALERLAKK